MGRDALDGPASMSALPRLPARTARAAQSEPADPRLAFTALPGELVTVCGLHGGAGTSRLTAAIGDAAAAASGPDRVLVTETDPAGGALAPRYGAASPQTIHDLARGRVVGGASFATLDSGLRLLAATPAGRTAAAPDAVATVLDGARAAHGLTVVDAGIVREPHNTAALALATTIIWTLCADRADELGALLASPLTRRGRAARWVIAVRPAAGHQVNLRALIAAAATAHTVVKLPHSTDAIELAAAIAPALA
jgi:Flp pilus assembly CpaE family ATPase